MSSNNNRTSDKITSNNELNTNDTTKFLRPLPNELIENKFDEILDKCKSMDVTCDFLKCKTKTNLMGQNCDLCTKRYCFKHALPEIHGCGEAIKKFERKTFLKPPTFKARQTEEDHKRAQNKLTEKLDTMRLNRKQKPNTNKSKKK